MAKLRFFGKILVDKITHVFIGSSLSGGLGMGRIDISLTVKSNSFMVRKLFVIIRYDRLRSRLAMTS